MSSWKILWLALIRSSYSSVICCDEREKKIKTSYACSLNGQYGLRDAFQYDNQIGFYLITTYLLKSVGKKNLG